MNPDLIQVKIKDHLNLHGKTWLVENPKANVILITGMEEHSGRYDELAKFLNEHRYSCHCLDYFGQGENVLCQEQKLGEVPVNAFLLFTQGLADYIQSIKGELPIYVLGHSMGSFIAQEFSQRYPDLVNKLVIVGSNGPDPLYGLGYMLANLTVRTKGYHRKSRFLASLAIGAYQKSVKNAKTNADWISYNEENIATYLQDPMSGKTSSRGFYKELLRGTSRLYKTSNVLRMDKDLPIFIISGQDDPVGKKGKGVEKLYCMYIKHNFRLVNMKLYPLMRHEILNEKDRHKVFNDLLDFLRV